MITSLKFNSDTLSHTTNVVPLIHIEKTIGSDVNRLGFSTQQLDFTDIDDNNLFYSPLLLSMPSLSESIDFESKKYKISSVTLKMSNLEYLGERLSDKYNILLNSTATIWYKTQSVDTLEECLKIYTGKVTRITHDYDVINLILEDKSQSKLHRDVPILKLSEGDGVPEKYRNKPVPMVYGHVERSPLVFTDNYQTLQADKLDIQFHQEPNKFGGSFDSLWMDVGHYINVKKDQYIEEANTIKITASSMPEQIGDESSGSLRCFDDSKNYRVTISNTLQSSELTTEDFEIESPGSVKKLSDSSYELNEIVWYGMRSRTYSNISDVGKQNDVILFYDSNDGTLAIDFRTIIKYKDDDGDESTTEFLLAKLGFEFLPQYDTEDIDGDPVHLVGMAINGVNLSDITPYNQGIALPLLGYVIQVNSEADSNTNNGDAIWNLSDNYSGYHSLGELYQNQYEEWRRVNYLFDFQNTNVDGVTGELYAPMTDPPNQQNVSTNPDAALHFDIGLNYTPNNNMLTANLSLTGDFSEMDLLREVNVTNVIESDFYANVIGRSHEDTFVYRDFKADINHIVSYGVNEEGLLYYPDQPWIDQLPLDENGELIYGRHTEHKIQLIALNPDHNFSICYIVPDFIEISSTASYYGTQNFYYPEDLQNYVNIRFSGKVYGANTINYPYEWSDTWTNDLYLLTEEPDLSEINYMWFISNESSTIIYFNDDAENLNYGTLGLAEKDKPSDIMLDILENECNYTDEVSENEIIDVRESHDKWKFAFTQYKSIDSKKLIEELSASTKSLPRFRGVDGKFVWNTVKDEYVEDDIDLTIKSKDVIKYSYDKTKLEDVKTKVRVKYFNDYIDDELKKETSYISVGELTYQEGGYSYDYYNIDSNDEDSTLEFESKYIRDRYTAEQLRNYLLAWNMNQHNLIKMTLPLPYALLEVGDVVAFDEEIQGLKLYGETYTANMGEHEDGFWADLNETYRNGQLIYPYFMIYKTKKNIDKIEIELIQLHYNDLNLFLTPEEGGGISLPSGDVNLDGNIDVLDIVASISHILGTSQLTQDQGYEADINQDGSLDILDIVILVGYILG